ncbi:phage tail protein [Xenorhabdus koppenhoeferi]|uniref:Phage tail fibre repeat-containing protein n=1 Tax=Xenorhabdus koppenhoeferi TaxID=351659 RepID=A0A1I7HNR6_9GAMM|nr:phage tail protein [Xenorhabdus koppenhoeferi]SFU62414.1 Phage tail fibre repeat-containing protein [Xenorhabdus koppenhoeferi]
MSTKYFAVLTQLGADKLANATALGTKIEITHMAVGDGGGSLPIPDTRQTKLINEKRRAAINTLSIDSKNKNQIIAEQIIPEEEGGWWIREIGLFDKDGILIAVGNCAESYKPQLQEGSGRTQTIRMILIVSSTGAVTLKVDPSVILATREYVDGAIEAHAKSHNHPDATLKEKGFVILSNAIDSNSETHAATSKAIKVAYENADTRLEKNKNGADIPNKNEFVKNLGLMETVEQAQKAVPESRTINGKPLSRDVTLIAGDVEAYTKTEVDNKIQNIGSKNTELKAQNGWWKCGDTGIIFQWGYSKGLLGESREWITFPITFPAICFGGLATPVMLNRTNGLVGAYFAGADRLGAWVVIDQAQNTYEESKLFWWAVGY